MSLRSPLGRVLGLGSAKQGVSHWWGQRLTAVGLIPLTLWLAGSLLLLGKLDHSTVVTWVSEPHHAIPLILLLVVLFYHSQLGLQVIIEDYVTGWARLVALVLSQFVHIILAVAGVFAVLRIAFGTG